jgi:hypothetical protein
MKNLYHSCSEGFAARKIMPGSNPIQTISKHNNFIVQVVKMSLQECPLAVLHNVFLSVWLVSRYSRHVLRLGENASFHRIFSLTLGDLHSLKNITG